jgi:dTDP-4-dehydrorhamnose 3,5-epimerase
MKVTETEIPGVLIVEPRVFTDSRGFFLETYHRERYREAGISAEPIQQNHSSSRRGTLRGLHYQLRKPQGKLLWAIRGEIFDVAVDIRPGSPTFGRHVSVNLSEENRKQIYVPPGLAHGFVALSDVADVLYQCSDLYDPSDEAGILWSDPALAIPWPIRDPLLSAKDAGLPPLASARLPQ